jgi:hypothetical protein
MRRFGLMRWLVDVFMVRPITQYGGWLTATPGFEKYQRKGRILARWMRFWTLLGSI